VDVTHHHNFAADGCDYSVTVSLSWNCVSNTIVSYYSATNVQHMYKYYIWNFSSPNCFPSNLFLLCTEAKAFDCLIELSNTVCFSFLDCEMDCILELLVFNMVFILTLNDTLRKGHPWQLKPCLQGATSLDQWFFYYVAYNTCKFTLCSQCEELNPLDTLELNKIL